MDSDRIGQDTYQTRYDPRRSGDVWTTERGPGTRRCVAAGRTGRRTRTVTVQHASCGAAQITISWCRSSKRCRLNVVTADVCLIRHGCGFTDLGMRGPALRSCSDAGRRVASTTTRTSRSTTQGGPAPTEAVPARDRQPATSALVGSALPQPCVTTNVEQNDGDADERHANGAVTTTTTTTSGRTFVIEHAVATAATEQMIHDHRDVIASSEPVTTTVNIPVITTTLFDQIAAANGIAADRDHRHRINRSRRSRAAVSPVGAACRSRRRRPRRSGSFFDGTSPTGFMSTVTGAEGVSLLSGFAAGPST